ncbi:MAG: bifunctional 5,10-methylenetetrahydrofolate dehydrogenase/5,10-methenyltetrahydrofolate cyclohydrolase [Chloroflexi bacterium]|nr:bifunctional 5,10-methylenetetrahydrofolate dehydrogenase/5,10-methenyltetrahydrofolate cyclohydrolase [Chloroflexota bacterium]
MSAQRLEGRPVADAIWDDVEPRAAAFAQRRGRLACLGLVSGTDDAAAAYGRQIERQFTRRGLAVTTRAASAADALAVIRELSRDTAIDGVLLLTPLPAGVDGEAAVLAIEPAKDVDGQHPANLGRLAQRRPTFVPATALGGLRLMRHYAIELRGARAVVVGRSPVVGIPLALLLLDADATVAVCHSRTRDLAAVTRAADILCVATGRAHLIGPQHVQPGSVVVDFGTNVGPDGATRGDVDTAAVAEVAAAITPVPGGTGPTTVAVLAEQTIHAAEQRER